MHPPFENLRITNTLSLHPKLAFLFGKGVRLWLIVRPSICSFCIAHFTFISTLHFCFGLIYSLAFSLFMCECEHGLNATAMHLTCCPFGGQ